MQKLSGLKFKISPSPLPNFNMAGAGGKGGKSRGSWGHLLGKEGTWGPLSAQNQRAASCAFKRREMSASDADRN